MVINKKNISKHNNHCEFICVAKYDLSRKNIDLFIKAISILQNKYPDHPIRGTLVGSSEYPHAGFIKFKKLVKELGVESCVTLKKNLPHNEMGNQYYGKNTLVLPSVHEPFSISPLEAMAHSLAVIITDTNGCKSLIEHEKNGLIAISNDVNSLVAEMKKFIDDPLLGDTIGSQARTYIENNHSYECFELKFNDVLKAFNMSLDE
jgi:glycosyltransferase involved in cell wall biosynthesis